MPTEKLTEAFVAHATVKPGEDRTIFWDKTLPRFGLRVTKTGHKAYLVQYRAGARGRAGTIRKLTIGPAGRHGIALDVARTEARKLIGRIAGRGDPLKEQRDAAAYAANTLQVVIERYFVVECGMDRDENGRAVFAEGTKLRSARERLQILERLVLPALGSMPISDVKRSHVVKLCDRIADENGPVMADRTLAYLRKVLNWHAIRSDAYVSPIVKGMMRATGRSRERILEDIELQRVWHTAGKAGVFGALVKFILLTAARRDEAAKLSWQEIVDADWTLPARRNKTKVDLVRPLPQAARDLLAGMPRVRKCRYAFTLNGATAIGGYSKPMRALQKASGTAGWTLHDLRRTARSLMSRAGVPPDHGEHVLGHLLPGMRKVYDKHKYYEEKRSALEKLAAMVDGIVTPPASNVVAFPGSSIAAAGADR